MLSIKNTIKVRAPPVGFEPVTIRSEEFCSFDAAFSCLIYINFDQVVRPERDKYPLKQLV